MAPTNSSHIRSCGRKNSRCLNMKLLCVPKKEQLVRKIAVAKILSLNRYVSQIARGHNR